MKKIILAIAMVVASLGVVGISNNASAHPWAYTYFHQNYQGLNRIINVKCHSSNSWKAMREGMTSDQVCGENGWITYIWVDNDVNLCARAFGSDDFKYWGTGGPMVAPPGKYHGYVTMGGCV